MTMLSATVVVCAHADNDAVVVTTVTIQCSLYICSMWVRRSGVSGDGGYVLLLPYNYD